MFLSKSKISYCWPIKFLWAPIIRGGCLARYSAFRLPLLLLKIRQPWAKLYGSHRLLQMREPDLLWGNSCNQHAEGPCWKCAFGHDVCASEEQELLEEDSVRIVERPFPENKNIGLLRWKHPYFWSQTSVLLFKEVRCLAPSAPSSRSLPLQKKFLKISYISYTTAQDALYLLKISGEG